ncbi:MAG: ATP-binding protein, partial [Candidatus Pacebacteria bacterium]|nr:ATP-binding protein [Candidatus Paceibacterota bacterium]
LVSDSISRDFLSDKNIDYISYLDYYKSDSPRANPLRLTIIDDKGNVTADSSANRDTMENHLNRKEINDAFLYGIGKDKRYSSTTGTNYMYIAVYNPDVNVVIRVSVIMSEISKIQRTIINYVFMGIVLFFLVTFIVSYKFSDMITRPVSEIALKSRLLSYGDYSVRVEIEKGQGRFTEELTELADTFNNMAETLDKVISDLKSSNNIMDTVLNSMNEGLIALDKKLDIILINRSALRIFKISEKTEYHGENIIKYIRNSEFIDFIEKSFRDILPASIEIETDFSTKEILKLSSVALKSGSFTEGIIITVQDITEKRKLEQVRTEFVSNVTHELKTPLTSIRGFIETLRTGLVEDQHTRDSFLEIIDIESERLYLLINDILQLSEIESKKSESLKDVCNVRDITDEVFRMLSIESSSYQVTTENRISSNVTVNANRERIKQLLINLVSNAIKYNVPKGKVIVDAYTEEGVFELKVQDTGIGIEETHIDRIFERFYRVDKGRSRKTGGTGLGLAIVKHIVNLYNGNVKVSSIPGKGSTFTVQLPDSD